MTKEWKHLKKLRHMCHDSSVVKRRGAAESDNGNSKIFEHTPATVTPHIIPSSSVNVDDKKV